MYGSTVKKDERANLKIPPEVKQRLKIAAALWGTSMEAISCDALEAVVTKLQALDPKQHALQDVITGALAPTGNQIQAPEPLPTRVATPTFGIPRADWHAMLDRVLDSKANHLVLAIVTNLLAFGRDAESIGKNRPPEKYEVYEARVMHALAEIMNPSQIDPSLLLGLVSEGDRSIVEQMIKDKNKDTDNAKPQEEPAGKRSNIRRKTV